MVRKEIPLMNSIFYPISHIKKPILLNFLIYFKSANHSKAFEMVSRVAQKAMTQFDVREIRYEIVQCMCVDVAVHKRLCAHWQTIWSVLQCRRINSSKHNPAWLPAFVLFPNLNVFRYLSFLIYFWFILIFLSLSLTRKVTHTLFSLTRKLTHTLFWVDPFGQVANHSFCWVFFRPYLLICRCSDFCMLASFKGSDATWNLLKVFYLICYHV